MQRIHSVRVCYCKLVYFLLKAVILHQYFLRLMLQACRCRRHQSYRRRKLARMWSQSSVI